MDATTEVLGVVEAARRRGAEPEVERELSVNEWVSRVRAACASAHAAARAGAVGAELEAWADVAAIAVGRAERLIAMVE